MSQKFRIVMDRPPGVFYPGDIVSGKVVLHSPEDEEVFNVAITFWGRSKSKISIRSNNSTHYYRNRFDLFRITQPVFPNHYTLKRNTVYEWPFSFIFPEWTMFDRTQECENPRHLPYDFVPGPHPLPPSFHIEVRNGYGYIQYGLEATTNRPSYRPLADELYLTFSPLREEAIPDESLVTTKMPFQYASSRLQPGHEDISRSFKELMRDTFSSSTPAIIFYVHVSLPKVIVIGQPFQLIIVLTYDSASTAVAPPRFTVKVESVRLKADVAVRATKSGLLGLSDKVRDTTVPFTLQSNWTHKNPDPAPTPYTSALGSNSTLREVEILPDVPVEVRVKVPRMPQLAPTYHSFSITNTHYLRASIAVTAVGKTFTHDFYSNGVTVLPARHRGQPPPGTSSPPMPMPMPAPSSYTDTDVSNYASVPPPGPEPQDHLASQAPPPEYATQTDTHSIHALTSPVGEEMIPTEQGLMLRYGPPTGIAATPSNPPTLTNRNRSSSSGVSSGASVAAAAAGTMGDASGLPAYEGTSNGVVMGPSGFVRPGSMVGDQKV
ncbi:uncharacterized protein STEHIDRAFT_171960 [Stereum hirsutum FP-91666 SS1]|uniref:uncharacterized protein n=1 Tax=Stereum hirsutum (strain FP-91666) TaxID=721885 RepID=UPI000444A236|nr:uncharacterized protein STEHIDRAFT_171960 [Stereum hirsutum FP-91666 SS1]EIM81674.1 hypothetical protein STEHIDRAFT_171960 [Stereum hirsutum FP-91666 SS1]